MKAKAIVLLTLTVFIIGAVSVISIEDMDGTTDASKVGLIVDGEVTHTYTSLETAISSNTGSFVLKMLDDVSNVDMIRITDGNEVFIDLNGKTIEFSKSTNSDRNYFEVQGGRLHIDGTGIVSEKNSEYYYAPVMLRGSVDSSNYSYVEIGKDVELRGWAGLFINQTEENDVAMNSGIVVNFAGRIISGHDYSNPPDYGHGIYVNGVIKDSNTPYVPEITIKDGSYIDADRGHGIYAAGSAKWTIDGATIKGYTGIEIRAGEMVVNDSYIEGKATSTTVDENGNGTTTEGAGIAIAQHTTKQPISLTTDGCEIRAATPFNESNPETNTPYQGVSFSIIGGSFIVTGSGTHSVKTQTDDFSGFIYGGQFSVAPSSNYIANGKTMVLISGMYCVSVITEPSSSGTVQSDDDSIIVNIGESNNVEVTLPSATIAINGDNSLGNVMISAESKQFSAAPDVIASYEITIVSDTAYSADITVAAEIPYGHVALAYYIDGSGNLIPVEVVSFTSSTVTFRTTHTTPFVIMSEIGTVITPDDEEDYPFLPGQGTNTGSSTDDGSNDSKMLVAAAAAIVVIMLAAVAMMVTRKN